MGCIFINKFCRKLQKTIIIIALDSYAGSIVSFQREKERKRETLRWKVTMTAHTHTYISYACLCYGACINQFNASTISGVIPLRRGSATKSLFAFTASHFFTHSSPSSSTLKFNQHSNRI